METQVTPQFFETSVRSIYKRNRKALDLSKDCHTMTMQSRMQLHVLVYKIVSLRITCGNYEDSPGSRRNLEVETQNRIRRLSELENKSELEVAESLCESYEERLRTRPRPPSSGLNPQLAWR
jgi:U3 small nucleolar ribonucleoprotein component